MNWHFIIMNKWLNHPGVNGGWITQQLYGDNSGKNRKKLSVKKAGTQNWTEEEKEKLESIRQQLLKQLTQ